MRDYRISISRKQFFVVALIYLMLPILIYVLGYIRLLLALPITIVLVALSVLALRDINKDPDGLVIDDTSIKISLSSFVVLVLFAIGFTVLSGVGEYMWSTIDHAYRRAMLNDLVNYDWPVIYSPDTQTNPEVIAILNSNSNSMFVYYFAYFLPSAMVGKIFGFEAANVFLVMWNALGIVLIIIGMSLYIKRFALVSIIVFLVFSGLDVIPYIFYSLTSEPDWYWIEGYVENMAMVSNWFTLSNVCNQCIPCWLIVSMLLLTKNNRSIGTYGSLLFAYSPFATISLLPLAIVRLLQKDLRAENTKKRITNVFGLQNLLMPIVILFVFVGFYVISSSTSVDNDFTYKYYDTFVHFLLSYLVLIAIEVLPIFILTVKNEYKNGLFIATIIELLILPIYMISDVNDLLMRGSMPALFILCILLTKRINDVTLEYRSIRESGSIPGTKDILKFIPYFIVVLLMSWCFYYCAQTSINETFVSKSEKPNNYIVSFGNIATNRYEVAVYTERNYLAYNYENQFYYKYVMRK